MDDLNLADEIEMFNSEKNAAENNIEDPFIVTDTNSSNDMVAKAIEDKCESKNHDVNLDIQNEEMIINDSIVVNQDIEIDKNLNDINQLESDQRSDVIDLMYANQEVAITNEKLAEELNRNLDVVSHEEEVRTTVEKEPTFSEAPVDTVITNELCENQPTSTTSIQPLEQNKQIDSQKILFPSPILPLRAFSTSKISIQKLPKIKPTTSAASSKTTSEENSTHLLNGYAKSSESKRKPDESVNTKTNTKTITTRSKIDNNSRVRYRQIKIIRLIRQTTTLTFRETYNPASNDYESMTLLSTKKSKEMDSESTECRVITEKEYNDEEENYFRQLDEDNDRNFTTNSSTNTSTSEENQRSVLNNHQQKSKKQESKTTRASSKRTKSRGSSSEDSGAEETQAEKKPNTQINVKHTPSSAISSSKTPKSTKKPDSFQSKPQSNKKNPLTKRDLNSYSTNEMTNTNNLVESNSKTSSSLYSSSRTPSCISSSPSIESIVFESDQANRTRRSANLEKKNQNRFNPNVDEKLSGNCLQVKLRRLTYDEMASANLVYKSDVSNETSVDSDDTLLNTTTLSQQQQQQQQRPLRQTQNMKECSVKLFRLPNLPNGNSGSNN